MYCTGQTLRHKVTGKLARLATGEDSAFAWDIGPGTQFIGEDGKPFKADIDDYIHVSNEWGEPQTGDFRGKGPDLSLKRYVVSDAKMAKMRKAALRRARKAAIVLEAELLGVLDGTLDRKRLQVVKGKVTQHVNQGSGQITDSRPHMANISTWPDRKTFPSSRYAGSKTFDFMDWFLTRRKAKTLYTRGGWSDKKQAQGHFAAARAFRYGGKRWVWHYMSKEDLTESTV